MKKQICAFFLAIVMLCGLTACGKSAGSVTLAEGGSTEYTVIYPAGANEEVMKAVTYLQSALEEATGVRFDAMEDMAVGSGEDSKEILVGQTDRAESTQAIEKLKFAGDYSVSIAGSKVVISAILDTALQQAAEKLVAEVSASSGDTVTLSGSFSVNAAVDSALQYLPAYSYGELESSYDCGDDASMLIYQSENEGYGSYLSDLEKNGYAKYTENTIGENNFATYTNEANKVAVHVMQLTAMKSVRIVAEPLGYLPATSASGVSSAVQPSVTMLGLEGYNTSGSSNQIGMSMLYQLSDGSFLMVDGGHATDTAVDQIYNTMKSLAPDPANITIAAWIITHGHSDHMSAITEFAQRYGSQVKVELCVWNLPNQTEFDNASEAVRDAREKLTAAAQQMNATVMKAHVGQVLYIRDAKVEILGSFELVAPQSLEYFNNSSLVFSVELGGQKIMMLADCGPLQTPALVQLYGSALKSDICQVGHHGYLGASSELYKQIDPDYLLWPGGSRSYENYKDTDYHVWVLKHAKQLWIAGSQITTLPLPITG